MRFRYKIAKGAKVYHCGPGGILARRSSLKSRGILSNISRAIAMALLLALLLASALAAHLMLTLPKIDKALSTTRPASIIFLDSHGRKIAGVNDMYGKTAELDRLPPHVWQAVIAVEDKRFFSHRGVDPRGLARAIWRNVRADKTIEGGSTITQQVAKNVFLNRSRTLARKIQELMISLWIEKKFSKKQILALYLNRVSLSRGRFGINAAAEDIFGKDAYRLNLAEAAILAGMLKAPGRYDPAQNPDRSLARAKVVLKLMLDQGYITPAQHEEAATYRYAPPKRTDFMTRYFTDYASAEMVSLIGEPEEDLVITTTLNLSAQRATEEAVRRAIAEHGAKFRFSQAAALFMDLSGGIRAMAGGRDYQASQFNRSTQMRRQPGSAFKPFVYLAALESGMEPGDIFVDMPVCMRGWCPKNHDGRYAGEVSMAEAMEKSLNTVPVRIAQKIGLKPIVKSANKLGLIDKMSDDYSIVLGTADATLADLAAAYATFANGGFGARPHSITKIANTRGETLYERRGKPSRLIERQTARQMDLMLRGAVAGGTGAAAGAGRANVRGKTGTSQDFRDAWFIGYTDRTAGGVWIGNDDNSPMADETYGGTAPARTFAEIIRKMEERQ
ncbi:MAG: PBP1A family penicillin-binding protein [Rickettsiales bacterium]|jgi:penicillin-binding protein 1A|nr:PBP1A family penicillin-binding protein [Rickettsiales bacterium]